MARRTSIHLPDHIEQVLGLRKEDSRSARITEIIERYGEIVRREVPVFTEAEWSAIADAMNGVYLGQGDASSVSHISMEVADADRLDGLGEKWSVDAEDLAKRIHELPYGAKVAIVEVVSRFWHSEKLNDLPTGELLREVGARIKEEKRR